MADAPVREAYVQRHALTYEMTPEGLRPVDQPVTEIVTASPVEEAPAAIEPSENQFHSAETAGDTGGPASPGE